jgi:hypothetical protein
MQSLEPGIWNLEFSGFNQLRRISIICICGLRFPFIIPKEPTDLPVGLPNGRKSGTRKIRALSEITHGTEGFTRRTAQWQEIRHAKNSRAIMRFPAKPTDLPVGLPNGRKSGTRSIRAPS